MDHENNTEPQLYTYLRLADVAAELEALPALLFDQLHHLVSVLVLITMHTQQPGLQRK
jgi:hypothetical protein